MGAPPKAKTFTVEEVSLHSTAQDCWLIINGKVYDVSSYLEEHPGGDDVLLEVTGKDAADDFEDAGHSEDARKLMEEYYIGDIGLSLSKPESKEIDNVYEKIVDIATKILPFAVPVACLGLAVLCIHVTLKRSK